MSNTYVLPSSHDNQFSHIHDIHVQEIWRSTMSKTKVLPTHLEFHFQDWGLMKKCEFGVKIDIIIRLPTTLSLLSKKGCGNGSLYMFLIIKRRFEFMFSHDSIYNILSVSIYDVFFNFYIFTICLFSFY